MITVAVQRLIGVLQKLNQVHEGFINLAEHKREALVNNKVDQLSMIVGKEAKLGRAVEQLLQEQADATNEFFRVKGFQPTRAITVTELSRMVTNPDEKAELLAVRERLTQTVAILQKKNELNQQLIQQSLAYINYSIDLVLGPDDEPTYQHPGSMQRQSNLPGYFDSRA
ncbi:flagellar protein FlgN [Paenibacillus sp. TRM 82003]|nr:flagellar protein FlgN [Paenibacillus sp. TRM 82003]MCI3923392.1 flagellar protein FlgN [Paenibacillus sp. TRM 82003]